MWITQTFSILWPEEPYERNFFLKNNYAFIMGNTWFWFFCFAIVSYRIRILMKRGSQSSHSLYQVQMHPGQLLSEAKCRQNGSLLTLLPRWCISAAQPTRQLWGYAIPLISSPKLQLPSRCRFHFFSFRIFYNGIILSKLIFLLFIYQ